MFSRLPHSPHRAPVEVQLTRPAASLTTDQITLAPTSDSPALNSSRETPHHSRTHQHSRRPAPGAPPAYPRPGTIILSRRPVYPKGRRTQKGKPPPVRGRGSPKGYPAARAPKPRGSRLDQLPARPLRTLSLPAVHNCPSGRSPSPPLATEAREERRTAPGPSARSPTAPPNSAAPAMLRLTPGLPGRHRQARPRHSRPQDKR
ncbi:hypothetical protein NDU88_009438 [Pleurodeles waltl]|uniref:Uncharacterized protein n=1 Tax=Pleurodeles waltl TaxID=8319 RepID=A0AAV7QRJ4_PLEWA|nr:hypothetical protein NDU88_009438 [Pleurodeles waltl]